MLVSGGMAWIFSGNGRRLDGQVSNLVTPDPPVIKKLP